MSRFYTILILSLTLSFGLKGQTIWDGPTMTFTKDNFADHTLEANQDRITDGLWITRAGSQGIFNIVSEASYSAGSSPADTEWAYGTTADIASLTFANWRSTNGNNNRPETLNADMVLHIISEDIYIDIKFTAWTEGNTNGGGFSYERSTEPSSSQTQLQDLGLGIAPNPAQTEIRIQGNTALLGYTIMDVMGSRLVEGRSEGEDEIDISYLAPGIYYLQVQGGATGRFVKY